jgi:hypothetical protein
VDGDAGDYRIATLRNAHPDLMLMIATMFKYIQFHPNKRKFQNNPKKVKLRRRLVS